MLLLVSLKNVMKNGQNPAFSFSSRKRAEKKGGISALDMYSDVSCSVVLYAKMSSRAHWEVSIRTTKRGHV